MVLLAILIIIILIVLFVLYWFNRGSLFFPGVGFFIPDVTSGARLYLINVDRYARGEPAYLGYTGTDTATFYAEPEPRAVWRWIVNKNQCFTLNEDPSWGCGDEQVFNPATGTFDCTPCAATQNTHKGYWMCSWCLQNQNSLSPITSISLQNDFNRNFFLRVRPPPELLTTQVIWNINNRDVPIGFRDYSYIWTDIAQPATVSATTPFDLTIRIKNVPIITTANVSFLGDTPEQGGIVGSNLEADDTAYFVSFLPLRTPN